METNYIIILDKYDDFECYLFTLEEKYRFRLSDCHWMVVEEIEESSYGFE